MIICMLFTVAAITDDYKCSGLKRHIITALQFWRSEDQHQSQWVRVKVLAAWLPFWRLWEKSVFCLFLFPDAACVPEFQRLCLSSFCTTLTPPSIAHPLWPSTHLPVSPRDILQWVYLDNPGSSPHHISAESCKVMQPQILELSMCTSLGSTTFYTTWLQTYCWFTVNFTISLSLFPCLCIV